MAITAAQRHKLPAKSFALPGRGTGPQGKGPGSYPIDTPGRARNALARGAQHASPGELATIKRKVHAKYPGIGKRQGGGAVTPLPITPGPQAGRPTRAEAAAGRHRVPQIGPGSVTKEYMNLFGGSDVDYPAGPRGYAKGGSVEPRADGGAMSPSAWSQMGHALRRAKGGAVAPAIGDRKLREGPPRYPKIAKDYV